MNDFLVVAAGGAFGAVCRYLVYILAGLFFGTGVATLTVNIVGSFVMGVLVEGMALAWNVNQQFRLFLLVGILGSFTTFSTFSLDVAVLYERGQLGLVAGYILISVICSIGALFAGMYLMRRVYAPIL